MTTTSKLVLALLVIVFTGCARTLPPTATPAPPLLSTLRCANVAAPVTCLEPLPEALLLQTTRQTTLRTANISLTFESTLYLRYADDRLSIIPLEGTAAIGAAGAMRVIQAGGQVNVPVNSALQSTDAPGEIIPYDANALRTLPLESLPRQVTLPVPIAPRQQPTNQTIITTGCTAPEGWAGAYTVQRGDTLTRIGALFNLSAAEIQAGNCLANPNALTPGQVLVVPGDLEAAPVASFAAETASIAGGECTSLTWQAENARLVYFQGRATTRSGTLQVCPEATITYTLLVVLENGEQVGYTATVTVR